ncbi:hypothetical protein J2Y63_006445 [Shinella sp. BE166]|uniref:hypothetical protein n=1 Tax=Shinella sp. BE166 TaxID=3373918 RepID=UPI003EBE3F79
MTGHEFGGDTYTRIMLTCLCAGTAVTVASCLIFLVSTIGVGTTTFPFLFMSALISALIGFLIGCASYIGVIAAAPSRLFLIPYLLNFPASFLTGKYIAGSSLWLFG